MNISSMAGGFPDSSMITEMRQRMFAKVDGNSDGGITQAEMKSFGAQMGLDESQIDDQFAKFDTDGNGAIDAKEHEAVFEQITEKLRGAFGQGGPQSASSDSSKDTNDVLMDMMDKIREHSQKQQDGGNVLQQFLSQLRQQSTSYDPSGSKESSSLPSFFSAAA